MNKVTKIGILSFVMFLLLPSCDNTSESVNSQPQSSTIQSVGSVISIKAYDIAINKNRYTSYDFLKNVKATDSIEGDITPSLTYKISNYYNGDEVEEITIDFSLDAKYHITYKAMNSKGQTAEKRVIFEIGNPGQVYDEFGNKKICWGTNFEYNYEEIQKDYKLVWSEDFETGTRLNEDEWKYETGNGVGGWGNQESQYYTKDSRNCFIQDGKLVIRALEQKMGNFNYTSARVRTYGETSWRYGRFDIKAKLPMGGGSWPAIWMMPLESVYGWWPASGEIDIMETSYSIYRNKILGTTHTTNGHGGNSVGGSRIMGETIYNDFHTYSIEWLPDKIIWYIDDVEYFRYDPKRFSACPTSAIWPYDQKFFLILNLAIGGTMGGTIDPELFNYYDVSMYVEEIKIYQSDIVNNLRQTNV